MEKPPKSPRPKPVSWRPKSQRIRDFYLSQGGAAWLNRLLQALMTGKDK